MDNWVDSTVVPRVGGGRRERLKQEKLSRIVRAATLLFAERGFEATTTQAIAEEAGIGAGTLFLYVRSKDDLLVRVVLQEFHHQLAEAHRRVPDDRALADQVNALFAALVTFQESDAALTRAFVKEMLFASDAERPGVRSLVDDFLGRLEDLVARAQERGEVAADVPAHSVAANLFALYFHLVQLRHGGHLPRVDLLPRLRGAVDLQIRGCAPAYGDG
jgi:AcrR family transcriptional regulator